MKEDSQDRPVVKRFINFINDDETDAIEQEEIHISKTLINFEEFGEAIDAWGIFSLSKVERFKQTPRPRWQYGISINKGVDNPSRYPRTDIEYFWENSEHRNKRFNEILSTLQSLGIHIVTIK